MPLLNPGNLLIQPPPFIGTGYDQGYIADGTNDYLSDTTGIPGAADSVSFTWYGKFKFDEISTVLDGYLLQNSSNGIALFYADAGSTQGYLWHRLENSSGQVIHEGRTSSVWNLDVDVEWFIALENTVSTGWIRQAIGQVGDPGSFVEEVGQVTNSTRFLTGDAVDFTKNNWGMWSQTNGNNKFEGTVYQQKFWIGSAHDVWDDAIREDIRDPDSYHALGTPIIDCYEDWNTGNLVDKGSGANVWTSNGLFVAA